MSTHVSVELIDVFAGDIQDPLFPNFADEFYLLGGVKVIGPNWSSEAPIGISPISIESGQTKDLQVSVFNEQVPINSTLAIGMKAYDDDAWSFWDEYGADIKLVTQIGEYLKIPYIDSANKIVDLLDLSYSFLGRDDLLGDYAYEEKVSELPLGETLITIDDFQEPDNCFFGFCDNSGWDYTVRYSITKWANDDLLGTPSKEQDDHLSSCEP